jgi:hypothetical protein
MLNAMSLLSRFSRSEKNLVERVVLNALGEQIGYRMFSASDTSAGINWRVRRLASSSGEADPRQHSGQCALEKFVECACGCEHWPG